MDQCGALGSVLITKIKNKKTVEDEMVEISIPSPFRYLKNWQTLNDRLIFVFLFVSPKFPFTKDRQTEMQEKGIFVPLEVITDASTDVTCA